MKITDIRSMKLWGPLRHGQGGDKTQMLAKIIVRVDTDAGIYGLGEVNDFAGVRRLFAYMREYFRGRDPFQINTIVSELMFGSLPPHHAEAKKGLLPGDIRAVPMYSPTVTTWGPVLWALSGVEMALCDLVGKALKTPIYNLLGGKFRDQARCTSTAAPQQRSPTWMRGKKMGEEAVQAGFSQIKFDVDHMATDAVGDVWNRSIPLRQIRRIVERLGAIRQAVGPEFELCADGHMQYNAPDSIRLAQALAPLDLLWFEDPMPISNLDSAADVRAKSPIAICLGEMFNAEQFRMFIDHKACDIIHPDVMFCGGLHEARRIADYAELHHLPMAMHGNGGALATIAAAHVAAASRNFLGLEYHFIETPWIAEYIERDAPLFRNGHVPVTDAPGLGLKLNEEVCRKYLAKGERMFD